MTVDLSAAVDQLRTAPGTPPRLAGCIALVPVHEDAYTLPFCVRSIAPVVDQVLLCLDSPDAATRRAVDGLTTEFDNVSVAWSTPEGATDPAGWAATRNRAIEVARQRFPDHAFVLMIDADDVLSCGGAERVLIPLFRDERVLHAQLGICELIGDWVTTARGRTLVYDPSHVFWRASAADVHFTTDADTQHERIHVVERSSGREIGPGRTRQVLFHGVLVKPGDQLLRRTFVRAWLQAGRPASIDAFIADNAVARFPRPWPAGLMPSEFVIFHSPGRGRPKPLFRWRRRLPPAIVAHQQAGPRFTMDLGARRRHDREPPSELERGVYERLAERSHRI
ncbi:MAG: hypothetical protein QOC97_1586 [Chloroflexota bacterium]|nr:hypothetical protein [Chloroflexota bacterium]